MKINSPFSLVSGASLFLLFAFLLISPLLNAQDNAVKKEPSIKQGSMLKAKFNRSALRKYVQKIESGTISKEEMVDYIVKGGSLKQYKHYDRLRSFFVGDPEYPLLNLFLKKRFDHNSDPADNRLELLAVSLAAGANPNFHVESARITKHDNLAPVLQACAGGDIEALELFVQYAGDLELREEVYTGTEGPCLATAKSLDMLNWLLLHGANIHFKDEYGKTLLHLAVESNASLEKIRWLIDQGISPHIKDQEGNQAISRVHDFISVHERNIQNFKDNASNSLEGQEKLQSSIKSENEIIAHLQKVAESLKEPK